LFTLFGALVPHNVLLQKVLLFFNVRMMGAPHPPLLSLPLLRPGSFPFSLVHSSFIFLERIGRGLPTVNPPPTTLNLPYLTASQRPSLPPASSFSQLSPPSLPENEDLERVAESFFISSTCGKFGLSIDFFPADEPVSAPPLTFTLPPFPLQSADPKELKRSLPRLDQDFLNPSCLLSLTATFRHPRTSPGCKSSSLLAVLRTIYHPPQNRSVLDKHFSQAPLLQSLRYSS